MKIFSKNLDRLLLVFPNVLLAVAIIHAILIVFFNFPFNPITALQLFVIESLFFSAFHVPLTFVLLRTLPEFKEWTKKSKTSGPFSFWVNTALVYILSAGLIYMGGGLFLHYSNSLYFFVFALSFKNILRIYHNIGQATGVSILINQKYLNQEQKSEEQKKIFKLRIWEGWMSNILIWVFSFYAFFMVLNIPGDNLYVTYVFFSLLLIPCFGLLAIGLLSPPKLRLIKSQFLLRHFLCPLQLFSPLAFAARIINHGIESFVIISTILKNSLSENRIYFLKIAFLISIIWIIWCIPRELRDEDLALGNARLFFSLLWAVDLTHFWAERVIYRMRDSYTRETIGPLLLNEPQKTL